MVCLVIQGMRKIDHTGMLLAGASCRTSTLPVSTQQSTAGVTWAPVDREKAQTPRICRVLLYLWWVLLRACAQLIHQSMLLKGILRDLNLACDTLTQTLQGRYPGPIGTEKHKLRDVAVYSDAIYGSCSRACAD
jgi:hypothetical protein